jgi:hypothetical protein
MAVVKPVVYDTRPEGHGSFGTLPELGRDEYDRLQDFYGFRHLTTHGYDKATKDQKYFRLWGVELKSGPAVFQPLILTPADPPNSRQEGTLVWNSWPGAADIPDNAAGPHYRSVGVHCWSDATGSCGWGYGGGSHIGACSTASLMASADSFGMDLFNIAAAAAPGSMANEHATVLYSLQNLVGYVNPKSEENPDGQDLEEFKEDLALLR